MSSIRKSKIQTGPSSTRIRDNQRRSRAQRKEFLDSLQQRVHEYERRGVMATVEVQQAARAVARENAALRRVLARHGVAREEIEREVRWANEGAAGDGVSSVERLDDVLKHQALSHEANSTTTSLSGCGNTCKQGDRSCETGDPLLEQLSNLGEPIVPVAPHPPPLVVSDVSSAAETSCIAAATIIAQMRGDEDDEFARTMLLGCHGTTDCRVKNTTVMRVLDEV
jgi:hypothetical protein